MIDINELINSGADESAIMEAVQKNLEEKRAIEEEKRKKEEAAKEQENLCREARAHLINAILAYNEAFHFLGEEPIDEAIGEELEKEIIRFEPVLKSLKVSLDNDNDMAFNHAVNSWLRDLWRWW